ncbi:hypothetical protein IP91_00115 [Pseudoduganella lurida]|uniref:Uncharacterized protein n=1 Tax=Pseudoduganella lurida TaxID=1036180 RepID=A0A562RKV1_9BURK|nr:hypothetical protein [Pseudoduganella lurida]TWI69050.1 hypothetical protein IP91_00115 [Pseudoduganella lurida]
MQMQLKMKLRLPWWAATYVRLCALINACGVPVDSAAVADKIVRNARMALSTTEASK